MKTLSRPARELALFLDVDGTIADIASEPDQAFVPEQTLQDLQRLGARLDGALALVSGRTLQALGRLAGAAGCVLVGSHGLEVSPADEPPEAAQWRHQASAIAIFLTERTLETAGLLVEHKPFSAALHFRKRPDLERFCAALVREAVDGYSGWHVLPGKMVFEARPDGASKGQAVRRLMQKPPFAGRAPIYFGDDATDEEAFVEVLRWDGVGVKVGTGESAATARLDSPAAVRAWLSRLSRQITVKQDRLEAGLILK